MRRSTDGVSVARTYTPAQQLSVCIGSLVAHGRAGAACLPAIHSTLPAPADPGSNWPSCGSQPEPSRDLFWGVGGKRLAPIRPRPTRSSRSSAAASARATPSTDPTSASGARSSRPRPRPRWWPRGFSGASATTSRRSTTSRSGRAEKAPVAEPAAAGAVPREQAGPPRPRRRRHLVVLPEPVRRHARR